MKKYLVFPGPVWSSDGDRHEIGFARLAELYRVPIRECLDARDCRGHYAEGLIPLVPDSSGRYEIPGKNMANQ